MISSSGKSRSNAGEELCGAPVLAGGSSPPAGARKGPPMTSTATLPIGAGGGAPSTTGRTGPQSGPRHMSRPFCRRSMTRIAFALRLPFGQSRSSAPWYGSSFFRRPNPDARNATKPARVPLEITLGNQSAATDKTALTCANGSPSSRACNGTEKTAKPPCNSFRRRVPLRDLGNQQASGRIGGRPRSNYSQMISGPILRDSDMLY